MSDNLLLQSLRPELLAMSAYHVADAKNYIKLDAMENPYTWPETAQQQWLQQLQHCAINRYPDPEAKALNQILRVYNHVPSAVDILLGNGSDEIIQILLMALQAQSCVMAPEPSFVMYKQIANSLGLDYVGVPLRADDFQLDMQAMRAAISQKQPALIFLAYPNNPSGNLFATADIEEILALTSGLVVIDEAYAPFAEASFIDRLNQHKRLLVMRTVSKLGLAGLRLGFLLGAPELISQFNKIRLPYNINALTQMTAEFALQHGDFLLTQTQQICSQRSRVDQALQAMHGIKTYPSAANFILFKTLNIEADKVFLTLKQHGVLIKNLSAQGGALKNCLRVTIGAAHENDAFLKALEFALNSANC